MKYFTENDKGKCINPGSWCWCGRTAQPRFSNPKGGYLYVRVLQYLREADEAEAKGEFAHRRRDAIQWIHGVRKPHYNNCVWTGMKNAGLIRKERVGRAFDYFITEKGKEYLELYNL